MTTPRAPATAPPALPSSQPALPSSPPARHGRRTIGALIAAAIAVAVILGVVILGVVLISGVGSPPPASGTQYPSVAGTLGVHLVQLQDAAEGTGLEDAVRDATQSAADGDLDATADHIDIVAALAEDAAAAGTLESEQATHIEAALIAIRADLGAQAPQPEEQDEPNGNGNGNENGNGKKD